MNRSLVVVAAGKWKRSGLSKRSVFSTDIKLPPAATAEVAPEVETGRGVTKHEKEKFTQENPSTVELRRCILAEHSGDGRSLHNPLTFSSIS